jgi:hypothetical protein
MSAAPHSVVHATNFVQEEDKKDANGKGSVSLAGQAGGDGTGRGQSAAWWLRHNSGGLESFPETRIVRGLLTDKTMEEMQWRWGGCV